MDEIYRENAKLVYHYLLKNCHNPQLAGELTQETFLQAMKSTKRFNESCKISVWLCAIAKHLWYQYLQKQGKEILVEEMPLETQRQERQPETQVTQKIELVEVLKEMQKLPQQMREVVYLRTMVELSFREIGEILGKSESWARVTFYRAKEHLVKGREQDE